MGSVADWSIFLGTVSTIYLGCFALVSGAFKGLKMTFSEILLGRYNSHDVRNTFVHARRVGYWLGLLPAASAVITAEPVASLGLSLTWKTNGALYLSILFEYAVLVVGSIAGWIRFARARDKLRTLNSARPESK